MNDMTINLTGDIVAAFVSNNSISANEVPGLIGGVHQALNDLLPSAKPVEPTYDPAVPVRASIKPDHIVCLQCGHKAKTLKSHLRTAHGLTPEEYRNRFGLIADYPMTSPNYAERRRQIAKDIGLGRKPREC